MYILKNAVRCINRAKSRNILIALIVVLLSVSSCIGLSIRQANKTLKKEYQNNMEISASVNAKSRETEITLDTLNSLKSKKTVKSFYKTASLYFASGDDIEPIDVAGSFKENKDFREEHGDIKNGESSTTTVEGTSAVFDTSNKITLLSNTDESQNENTPPEQKPQEEKNEEKENETPADDSNKDNTDADNPQKEQNESGNKESEKSISPPENKSFDNKSAPQPPDGDTFITNNFFFNMASMNDFSVIGCEDTKSLPDYVSSLGVLDLKSDDYKCVISKNLAEENEFKVGDTFTLKNPENEDETYKFTIAGICDSSTDSNNGETASNASFADNSIYVNYATAQNIISKSSALNGTAKTEKNENKLIALSASYSGSFIFANLKDYNSFCKSISDDYSVVSEDVERYEESVSQLETLGKYATYFLIVIFVIGAFVLVIINLQSIRNRKYEIGVLTAIGMKKQKVALQFILELFIVTFAALIIGSSVGAVSSVPVTNKLLKTINTSTAQTDTQNDDKNTDRMTPPERPDSAQNEKTPPDGMPGGGFKAIKNKTENFVASVNSATNITVILEMIAVGIILTLISSVAALVIVMRYEPLKILNNRD
ncbi:MAG: ABC transporter permease [Clostridia bacterium]|nr:ABC transporter permease [Clostridia bacterium]